MNNAIKNETIRYENLQDDATIPELKTKGSTSINVESLRHSFYGKNNYIASI